MTSKKIFSNKTISYIEAIVYIIAIIVAVLACNCGSLYIRMLPILFILGMVGKIIFDRPVVTTIFGIVTSLCIIKLTSSEMLYNNFLLSLCSGLNIALGELFGEYLLKSQKLLKKKKKIKNKGVLKTYIITIIILAISLGIHVYTNGNFISYFIARNNLNSYLNENYSNEKFKIVDCKYSFYKTKSYTFETKNIGKNINTNFVVVASNKYAVYDEYKFKTQSQNNTKLNNGYLEFFKTVNTNLNTKIGYIDSGEIKLVIHKSVDNVNKENIQSFASEVNTFLIQLKGFSKYNNIDKIEILLEDLNNNENSLISDFETNNINDKDNFEYILNSLSIEFID